jgi:hypothetical protein
MLNTVLAAAVVVLAWRFASEWKRGNERYAQHGQTAAGDAPSYALPSGGGQLRTLGGEVVAKNLFTPDRNSSLASAATAAAAPLPVIFGTMQLGTGYEALAAEGGPQASRNFRRVKSGEQIGPYTLVEIYDDRVVVERQGQKTTIDVYQSAKSVAPPQAAEARPARPTQATQPVVEAVSAPTSVSASASSSSASAPPAGVTIQKSTPTVAGPGVRVTMEGNRRRVERDTPFGPQVWYEEIQ